MRRSFISAWAGLAAACGVSSAGGAQEDTALEPADYLHPSGFQQMESIDNLVHRPGYETAPLGELQRIDQVGQGPVDLVILTGLGMAVENFLPFAETNAERYSMHIVAMPGMGGTQAPPMPGEAVSYGERTWTAAFEQAVINYIEEQELENVVLAGHHIPATGSALLIAQARPDLVEKVVIFGGEAGRCNQGDDCPAIADRFAENWFKTVTPAMWTQGNYQGSSFSRDETIGGGIARQQDMVEIPVMVQYLLEFIALDIVPALAEYETPTLVLTPDFDESATRTSEIFFVDSWSRLTGDHENFELVAIPDAHGLVWLDNPDAVNAAVAGFAAD